jgi:uncharacterized protein (DUF1499 family)
MMLRSSPSLGIAALIALSCAACRGTRPVDLGPDDGNLKPCPDKPNCVSSSGPDEDHEVTALRLQGSPRQSLQKVKRIVLGMPRTRIVEERDDYLAVEFESLIFRYVDDVEFYAPSHAKAIQVRSASRLGHSDLGVNRKRIESIREAYERP